MKKTAPVTFNIHPIIAERWSPRAFSNEPVPTETLQRLFEAARWAPSGYNDQSWRFIIGIKGDLTYDNLFGTLVEFNQLWAGNAPVLVLVCGVVTSAKTGQPNPAFAYDVGMAVASLTFQATSEGYFVHQMGGFDREEAKKRFSLPPDVEPLTIIAIGSYGDPAQLHENLQPLEKAGRNRNKFNTFVFANTYGQPSSLFGPND